MMIVDDDYYAEEGFRNYVPSTTDPGPWMLFGVCIYALCCIVCLPICVRFAKKRRKRRKEKEVKLNEIIINCSGKSIGPVLEEDKEEDTINLENSMMNCIIGLSGKAILENGRLDAKTQKNCIDPEYLTNEVRTLMFFLNLRV